MKKAKKKKVSPVWLHKFSFHLVRLLIFPFLALKFHYSYDPIPDIGGPYLLLCNHNMNVDPIWVGSSARRHTYFVATDHVLHAGLKSRLLMFLLNPILITKGKMAASTVLECMKRLRSGHSVCIFPEGNRSFSGITGTIGSGTAKLAQRSGVPLVTFRLEGGYLTHPRWSLATRSGKIHGRLVHVYSREELTAMTDAQLQKAIETDLYENAWETQRQWQVPYRCKAPAKGLESALYLCPQCRSVSLLKSSADALSCSCGFSAAFSTLGELTLPDRLPFSDRTVSGWSDWQRKALAEQVQTVPADRPLCTDSVRVHIYSTESEAPTVSEAAMQGFCDRVEIALPDRKITVTADDSEGVSIFSRNTLTFLLSDGRRLDIHGDDDFCGLKYVDLYHILKNRR